MYLQFDPSTIYSSLEPSPWWPGVTEDLLVPVSILNDGSRLSSSCMTCVSGLGLPLRYIRPLCWMHLVYLCVRHAILNWILKLCMISYLWLIWLLIILDLWTTGSRINAPNSSKAYLFFGGSLFSYLFGPYYLTTCQLPSWLVCLRIWFKTVPYSGLSHALACVTWLCCSTFDVRPMNLKYWT